MEESDQPLAGKVAIVTGASRGIGRAIAIQLARKGAGIVLAGRDEALLSEVVRLILGFGGSAISVSLDLRVPESSRLLVDEAVSAFGRIDILVNNAGATKRGEFIDLTDEDWADGYALKLFGAVRLSRLAWPELKKNGGSVINIAGVGGRTPGPQFTIGGSVNAALLSFTKALADVGVRDGVQVNAINPGSVRTDRLARRFTEEAAKEGVDVETVARNFIRTAHIRRIGEPHDIAALVGFILSPAGSLLQGALIDMDGGQTKTL